MTVYNMKFVEISIYMNDNPEANKVEKRNLPPKLLAFS